MTRKQFLKTAVSVKIEDSAFSAPTPLSQQSQPTQFSKESCRLALGACLDCLPVSQHAAFKTAVIDLANKVGIVDALDQVSKDFRIHQ